MTIVMPSGPVSCIGGTKYPHCIVLYCNQALLRVYLLINVKKLQFNNVLTDISLHVLTDTSKTAMSKK